MRLEYFLVADSVSLDQSTNTASVFHILEEIQVNRFPVQVRFVALSTFLFDPEEFGREMTLTLQMTGPLPQPVTFETTLVTATRRHRVTNRFAGFPVSEAGTVTIELLLDGEHQANHEFEVKLSEPPAG